MSTKPPGRDPYLVKSVVHSSQLLSAFRSSGEALPLREVSARSGLPKSMAFRLLYTLERCVPSNRFLRTSDSLSVEAETACGINNLA